MIHLQYNTPGWADCLPLLPDGSLIKLVDMVQTAAEVKGVNPRLKTLLRHVNNEGYVWSLDWDANVAQAEKEFLTYIDNTFADYAHLVDYVEEPRNEYVDNGMSGQQLEARVQWARACAYVWQSEFQTRWPHIQLLIGSQPVGNDIPIGFFKAAHDYGAGISTHAYVHFTSRGQRDPGDFRWHSGRWAANDEEARAQGYEVPIAVTETGPYDGSTWGGWRDSNVLGGDVAGYVDAMRDVIRDWATTHAYQTGRLLGFNLFTTIRNGWDNYQTNQPELNTLAAMVAQEWNPGEPPPPPPPPPPDDCRGTPRVQYKRTVRVAHGSVPEVAMGQIYRDAWPNRNTVGWSFDDAGIGDLDDRAVVAYGVPEHEQQLYRDWYAEHYPGVEVSFRDVFYFEIWPVDAARVTTAPFGQWRGGAYYADWGYPAHEGVDLRAPLGANIRTVADGVVAEVRESEGGYGMRVRVAHSNGYETTYGHLAPNPPVSVGQQLTAGQVIGTSGNTGDSTGPHLHLTLRHAGHDDPLWGDIVDPTPWLAAIA